MDSENDIYYNVKAQTQLIYMRTERICADKYSKVDLSTEDKNILFLNCVNKINAAVEPYI